MKPAHGLWLGALVAIMFGVPVFAGPLTSTANTPAASVLDSVAPPAGGAGELPEPPKSSASVAATAEAHASSHLSTIGSFSDFLAVLNAGSLNTTIGDVGAISHVEVVNVAATYNDFDANAFHAALTANETSIAALRAKLDANVETRTLLLGNNVSISHIVGIDTHQDGTLVIYIDGQN